MTRIRSIRLVLVALGAAFGCAEEPTGGLIDASLVGAWATTVEPLAPQGSWQRMLVVRRDGRVAWGGVMRGVYAGQAAADLSSEVMLHGRIGLGDGAFIVRPDSVVTHDRFYGPTHRAVQRDFAGMPAGAADSTRYVIRGDELVLSYTTYPADAPVPTREVLRRVRME